MPIIDCFKLAKRNDLADKHQELIDKGVDPYIAAREIMFSEHERLHEKMNGLRKSLNKSNPKEKIAIPKYNRDVFDRTTVDKINKEAEQSLSSLANASKPIKETSKEPLPFIQEVTGNKKAVTLSGNSEAKRQKLIANRVVKTTLSGAQKSESELAKKVKRFNDMTPTEKVKNNELLTAIKNGADGRFKVDNLGADRPVYVTKKTDKGKRINIQMLRKDIGPRSLAPNGKALHERPQEFQREFVKLMDLGIPFEFRNIEDNGKFKPSQEASAIADIYDGIPSEQAEIVLNTVQKAIETNQIEFGDQKQGFGVKSLKEAIDEIAIEQNAEDYKALSVENLEKYYKENVELQEQFEQIIQQEYENIANGVDETTATELNGESQTTNAQSDSKELPDEKADEKYQSQEGVDKGYIGIVGMTRKIMKQEEIDNNLTDNEKSELFQHSSDEKAWADVNKKIQQNPNLYQERVNATFEDALKGDKPKVSDDDALIALHEKVKLRVEHNDVSRKITEATQKGDNLSAMSLLLEREAIENKQLENKQFIKLITSSGGKLLRSARLLSGEDFSFSGLTHEIEKEQGFPLTKEQQDKYRKLADDHEALTKQMAELQNKIKADENLRLAKEEADRKKFEDDTIKRLKAEVAKEKGSTKPAVRTKEVIKAELDKARAQLRIDLAQLSSGGLQAIGSFVEVVKLAAELNIKNASAFLKEFRDDLKGYSDKEIMDAFNVVNGKNEFEKLTTKAVDLASGELHTGMKSTIDKMLKAVVESNPEITHVEAVDKIYEALKKDLPDIDRSEVRDLISGYGKYKLLSKEQIPVAIREIKTLNRLDAGLDAVNVKNELPLRTGMERHEKTGAARTKEAEILRIIKEKGLTPDLSESDIAKQYKSAEATYQKRIENAITDIEKEIETGERKAKANPKEYNSERSKQLKADLERLKEIRDAKFSEPKKTAGELKIEALRNKIDEINQRVITTKETKGVDISDADLKTIKDLQEELYQAKQEAGLIKGKDFKSAEEKRLESEANKLENLKSKLDDLLAGKVRDKKISEPDSQEVKDLKAQIKAIEFPPKTEAEKQLAKEYTKEKATQRAIDDISAEIELLKNGDTIDGEPTVRTKDGKQVFDIKTKQADKVTNDRIKELEALKENLKDEKSNLIPAEIKKQAIILKERTNRQRRLENLESQVRDKNYAPKPKPEAKPYDAKVEETNLKIKKLESIVSNDKEKIRLANRGLFEKGIDFVSKLHRFMIFTNPAGMGRLTLAALYRPAIRIPVEFAKYALSKLPVTRRIIEKSSGMYRPTIGSAVRATKNYYSTLVASKTLKDAASEYKKRSNFSLLYDDKATDRYNTKLDLVLAAPEMSHGFLKSFPKLSALESTYKASLENLNNTIDPKTGVHYDITDPRVLQIAMNEAVMEAYADVFMNYSELSNLSNKMLAGLASSENLAVQVVGLYGKQLQPVLKVPANFYHEVLQQLPVIGLLDAAQVVARSGEKGAKALKDGSYRGIDNLTPEQAHKASRAMVNSAVGLMAVAFGMALYKKYEDEAIEKIEKYHYWAHNTALPLFMMGLGIGKDLKEDKGIVASTAKQEVRAIVDETVKLPQLKAAAQVTKLGWSAAKAAKLDAQGVQEVAGKSNWDGASKQAKEMLATLLIPSGAADIAKRMDDNRKRDPKTFMEILKMRIPGLRETVSGGQIPDEARNRPAIKYFVDRNIPLSSRPLDKELVKDIPTKTNKVITAYSLPLQKLYTSTHLRIFEKNLQKVINRGYVYKQEGYSGNISNQYTKDGVKRNKVLLSKLTDKELEEVLSNAMTSATDLAKKKVFTRSAQLSDKK